jgi:hypothetical protein
MIILTIVVEEVEHAVTSEGIVSGMGKVSNAKKIWPADYLKQ